MCLFDINHLTGTIIVASDDLSLVGISTANGSEQSANKIRGRHKFPNIIFILADDLGYGDVGYNGGKAFTPNLDKMARDHHSIRFDRFYSSSPVCSPTRGSLLTGRNPNRFCVWRANTAGKDKLSRGDFLAPSKYPLPQSEITLPEILKEHGYSTAVFGKWHIGDLTSGTVATATSRSSAPRVTRTSSNPSDHGFETWKVTERSAPTVNLNCACFDPSRCVLGHYHKQGPPPCTNYHSPSPVKSSFQALKPHPTIITQDDSEFLADEFSEFLQAQLVGNASERKPFFAYLPFHAVHNRYLSAATYGRLYANHSGLSRKEFDYYSSISALDAAVGKIRSLLKQHGVSNNTMLWFSSDNGPAQRSPGNTAGLRGHKGTLHEGGIRVPGIVEWPAVIQGNKISKHPVVTSDFFPTVLDSLELLPPNIELDGMSLLPLLQSRSTPNSTTGSRSQKNSIKWAFNVKGNFSNRYTAVLLDNDFKMVVEYNRGRQTSYALYNLSKDLQESHDVSRSHTTLSRTLRNRLDKWWESVVSSTLHESKCLSS